ncbi:geranylgeranylglyceryl/heptaprenylglyceryl phosphate synthase [Flavobacteriales bacterium]|nr:geranylgeranylglyceryl/heptaprenylglyceryl phosphate synthase [Flavobacteriales bacterium]
MNESKAHPVSERWITSLESAVAQGRKGLAVLVDPDKVKSESDLDWMSREGSEAVHTVLLGGSLVTEGSMDAVAGWIRERTDAPIVLFPGSPSQLTAEADALLFLSVISGRNPDALIGKHVEAAPRVRELGLDAVGCGYMLIDGGRTTTAHYMSGSLPIPGDKPDIAAATALASHYLGQQCMYMDTGSGADHPVSSEMIAAVRAAVPCPIIVGGGMTTADDVIDAWAAGADLAVVGSAIERDPDFLRAFAAQAERQR